MVEMPVRTDDTAHRLAADRCDAGQQPRHFGFVLGVDQEQSVVADREPYIETHIPPGVAPGHAVDAGSHLDCVVLAFALGLRGRRRNC